MPGKEEAAELGSVPDQVDPGISRGTADLGPGAALRSFAGAPTRMRGFSSGRADALLRLQRTVGNRAARRVLARELAIAPTVAQPAEVNLTAEQLRVAKLVNEVLFTDGAEIAVLRDVLGIDRQPSVVDDDLTRAIARYQSSYGLAPDGKLGALTSDRLAQELTAEADAIGDAPTGTELRRVARRLTLRSMTSRTRGTFAHQGFVGDDDNPRGAVTVRMGDREGAVTNAISIEYTGEDSNSVHWLQFVSDEMEATPPAGGRVFATGTVDTSSGPVQWSNLTTQNFVVDSIPNSPAAAPSPFYDTSGGLNTRAAARRVALLDTPGGDSVVGVAQDFVAAGPAAGATAVIFRARFSSYVVKANRASYRVDWVATTTVDTAAGTASPIVYSRGFAGQVGGLRAAHRTALVAQFAGSAIR